MVIFGSISSGVTCSCQNRIIIKGLKSKALEGPGLFSFPLHKKFLPSSYFVSGRTTFFQHHARDRTWQAGLLLLSARGCITRPVGGGGGGIQSFHLHQVIDSLEVKRDNNCFYGISSFADNYL